MCEEERDVLESNRHHHRAKRVFGALFLQYERHFWWYECTELLRKATMTGGLTLAGSDQLSRCSAGVVVCVISMILSMNARPYYSGLDNSLQQGLLVILFFNFFNSSKTKIIDRESDCEFGGPWLKPWS